MANNNTKAARKRGYSSMKDMLTNGHKIVTGRCVDTKRWTRTPWLARAKEMRDRMLDKMLDY